MKKVVELYKSTTFKDPKLKEKTTVILSKNSTAARMITGELSALINNISLEDLLVKNSSSLFKAYAANIKSEVSNKSYENVTKKLQSLLDIKLGNKALKKAAENTAKEVTTALSSFLLSPSGKAVTIEEMESYHEICDIISKTVYHSL